MEPELDPEPEPGAGSSISGGGSIERDSRAAAEVHAQRLGGTRNPRVVVVIVFSGATYSNVSRDVHTSSKFRQLSQKHLGSFLAPPCADVYVDEPFRAASGDEALLRSAKQS